MGNSDNREIEANFINFDVDGLKAKLIELGAIDHGEILLKERIFYPQATTQGGTPKFVRLRVMPDKILLAYKDRQKETVDGTEEIEFGIDDLELATLFVQRLGYHYIRNAEKKRHSFTLQNVLYDIDIWPFGKPILQIEGSSAEIVRRASEALGLAWDDATFTAPSDIFLQQGIDFESYKTITFEKLEQYND